MSVVSSPRPATTCPPSSISRWRAPRATINDRWLDAVATTAARHNVWLRVIDGNHDAHPLARSAYPADPNGVRPIRSGVLDWADRGSVWDWSGRTFAALGGAVSIDKQFRVEGHSWWPTEEISDEDVHTLLLSAGGEDVDVLLTHDAPYLPPGIRELSDPGLAASCRRSNRLIEFAVNTLQPELLMHGHYHRDYQRRITRSWGNYRIVGLSSDQESRDPYGGPWTVLELPSLRVLALADL